MQSALRTLPLISAVAAVVLVAASASAQFSGPSFGTLLNKKRVILTSKIPPVYNATGKVVAIAFADPNGPLQQELEIGLEKDLTKNDSGITVGGAKPDLLIECKVDRFSSPKVETVHEIDGQSTHIIGDISVLFRITEIRTQRTIKSDIATVEVNQETSKTTNAQPASKVLGIKTKASGPTTTDTKGAFATTDDAARYLISQVDHRIATYLVNSTGSVEVNLAVGGALSDADKLAVGTLWTRYLETLETMTPYPDAKNDVFRIYDIGVANEALAYQTQDVPSAMKYLEQASNDYGKALDTRADEKEFVNSQRRIKLALEQYEQIGKFASSAGPPVVAVAGPAEAPLTNQDVIDMVKAHMDEANIVDTIQHAGTQGFDLGAKGQIALTHAGVNSKVLLAMKQRARTDTPTGR